MAGARSSCRALRLLCTRCLLLGATSRGCCSSCHCSPASTRVCRRLPRSCRRSSVAAAVAPADPCPRRRDVRPLRRPPHTAARLPLLRPAPHLAPQPTVAAFSAACRRPRSGHARNGQLRRPCPRTPALPRIGNPARRCLSPPVGTPSAVVAPRSSHHRCPFTNIRMCTVAIASFRNIALVSPLDNP